MPVDYHAYIQSPAWRKRARAAKKRAKGRCQVCYSDGELHAHHRTYERLGKELASDLVVLCAHCHALFHDRLPEAPAQGPGGHTWEQLFNTWKIPRKPPEHPKYGPWYHYEFGKGFLRNAIGNTGDMHPLMQEGIRALTAWLGI